MSFLQNLSPLNTVVKLSKNILHKVIIEQSENINQVGGLHSKQLPKDLEIKDSEITN